MRSVLIWGGIGAGSLAFLGLLFSQFSPVFGGFMAAVARPFSPYRLSLIPIHLLVFGLVGGMLGTGFAVLRDYSDRRR